MHATACLAAAAALSPAPQENLRELCVFKLANDSGKPYLWCVPWLRLPAAPACCACWACWACLCAVGLPSLPHIAGLHGVTACRMWQCRACLHRSPCPMARQSLWGTCSPRDDQMWPALPLFALLCARRWDYVTRFAAECDMGKKEYGTECSEKVRDGRVRPSQCGPLRVQWGRLLHVGGIVGPHHVWYRGGGAAGVWEKVWGGGEG